MGTRVYSVNIEQVAVTAVQDLIQLTNANDMVLELISAFVGQHTDAGDAQAELLPIQITRYATGGSAGSAQAPVAHSPGDVATSVTGAKNNTTQGGTPTVVLAEVFNVQAGWLYQPVPEERIRVVPSGIIAIELPVAPADSLTITARLTFAEVD